MRAHAHLAIASLFHAQERILHTGHRLTTAQESFVVNEAIAVDRSNHLFRQILRLPLIERDLITFMQKNLRL